MAPFLPPICDDETLRGYLRRVVAISAGHVATPDAMIEQLGRRLIHPSMPNGILAITQLIGGVCGSAECVLHEHTLFDYYFALSPGHLALERARSMLGRQPGARVPTRYPLVFSISDGASPRCPTCDETTTDGVYLHTEFRIHLMPFQRYCPIHGDVLRYIDCTEPTIMANASRCGHLSQTLRQQTFDVKSMEWAQSALTGRRGLIERQLYEKRYTSGSGRIYRAKLVADLQKFFSDGFIDNRLTFVVNSPSAICHFLDSLRRPDRVPPTAIGILLEWYLDRCEPLDATPARRASAQDRMSFIISPEELCDPGSSIRSLAADRNIPYRTLLDAAIRAGRPVKCRPKKFDLGMQEFAVAQLCSGNSRTDVARCCKVSIQSIHRLCARRGLGEQIRAEADNHRRLLARTAWLNAFAESPGSSRSELRRVLGADWTWLRRHDSKWLKSVEALCMTCVPSARVCPDFHTSASALAVAAAIETAVKADLESVTQPRRLTKTRLARLTGVSPFVLDTTSACAEMTESEKDWVTRRLAWASQTLGAEYLDTGHNNWRLWRTARIRPRSSQVT